MQSWWNRYLRYIHLVMVIPVRHDENDVSYWRELSFVKIIAYLLPISLLAFIPRIILGFLGNNLFLPVFDLLVYLLLCNVLLYNGFTVTFKKVFVITMLYIFALAQLFVQGATGPGIHYLTCTCIFTVFLFKGNRIYYSLLANFIIAVSIALLLHLHPFHFPLERHFDTFSWLNYASNLLFINLVCLVMIQRVIQRLERIIVKESELQGQLADEILEKELLVNKLQESEDYYRYLFSSNPIPMWVYDTGTLCFLLVNDAAVKHYGYSREEFLDMTIDKIYPAEELDNLDKNLKATRKANIDFKGLTTHMKKKNQTFPVEIRSNPIEINGKFGRLVLATDITDRVRYINDIEDQNKRLKHIAWIQSHKVRAPLARVMSLSDLLSRQLPAADKEDILKYLIISTAELNEIVTTIIKQAEAE
jgi:PAS domain S-box-containing protein